MLAFFNTQTLALLAVAVGFVVLCLGLWYLWTNHTQLRTEVQLLRSQQQSGSGSGYQALATTESPSSPVPDAGAADITALMRGETTGACTAAVAAPSTPDVRVCRMPEASMAAAHVVHRTEADGDDASEGSDTSGSEYDDDDEDITDDEEEEGTQTVAPADAADEASNALTEVNANATGTVPDDGQPPVDLVESLLSSMVTNAIDGAVELQGGATVIMSCVDVGDGDDGGAEPGVEAAVTIEDVTEADEVAAAAVDATAEADDDDDAASALDAGAAAFADELRSHTVAQLKVICQEHQLGVRRANGSSKRKDELVADLVAALYEGGGEDGEDDDAQETASNESANAAGA